MKVECIEKLVFSKAGYENILSAKKKIEIKNSP